MKNERYALELEVERKKKDLHSSNKICKSETKYSAHSRNDSDVLYLVIFGCIATASYSYDWNTGRVS